MLGTGAVLIKKFEVQTGTNGVLSNDAFESSLFKRTCEDGQGYSEARSPTKVSLMASTKHLVWAKLLLQIPANGQGL